VRDLTETNRRQWDERTPIHVASGYYNLDAFMAGHSTLHRIELEELGDVSGKRLLHLMCHFGLDTLSWARLGAHVTGADFSAEAIKIARQLADDAHLDARFVCSDVYDLTESLDARFDIVFTSYGVLVWLPDLPRWAETIAHFLDDGGVFYMVEEHPVGGMFEEEEGRLVAAEPYFDIGPVEVPPSTYADRSAALSSPSYQWQHSLSDVINALTGAGLRIEFLNEFPFCGWQRLPSLEQHEDGFWYPQDTDTLPLLFSLQARKA
jgi:SAM-dependent methyltransferase